MAATISELKELAVHAANHTAPANFTVDTVNTALAAEIKNLSGSLNEFMKNRFDIYSIVTTTLDIEQPKKVIDRIGIFADVQTVPQGAKAVFKRTVGRNRAKQFLTQVGLSGVYETFRLDKANFEIETKAIGGAVTMDFERWLDGEEDINELMDIITEGLTEAVFGEVQKALKAAADSTGKFPEANQVVANNFDSDRMFKLCSVVKAYGDGAVIFAPPEFIGAMGADAIVPGFVYPVGSTTPSAGMQGVYHPQDIDAIHNTGYINMFRGTPVVQIPQSYVDENNVKTQIDPQLAYILPTGREKVVKVVLEGATQMHDFVNADHSMEIHAYKKMGAAILTYHNWCIYKNEGIEQTYDTPWGV